MSDNIQQLEREVEAARARLAGDLSTLRSPATLADFTDTLKEEAIDAKDALLDKAKSSARSMFDDIVETVKAKAAANPTAVLAIGAGIAWRLIQRPPIASVLIGAGLLSLMRATPARINGRDDADYLDHAKGRLKEQASDLAETIRVEAVAVGGAVKEKASEFADATRDKASELVGATKDRVPELGVEARSAAQGAAASLKERTASLAGRASETLRDTRPSPSPMEDDWSNSFPETVSEQEIRNTVLLGAAGVAVVTALGIAFQRRQREDAEVE